MIIIRFYLCFNVLFYFIVRGKYIIFVDLCRFFCFFLVVVKRRKEEEEEEKEKENKKIRKEIIK